jgi:hypothetical protein
MPHLTDEQISRVLDGFAALNTQLEGTGAAPIRASWHGAREPYSGGKLSISLSRNRGEGGYGQTVVEAIWDGRELALENPFKLVDTDRHMVQRVLGMAVK